MFSGDRSNTETGGDGDDTVPRETVLRDTVVRVGCDDTVPCATPLRDTVLCAG